MCIYVSVLQRLIRMTPKMIKQMCLNFVNFFCKILGWQFDELTFPPDTSLFSCDDDQRLTAVGIKPGWYWSLVEEQVPEGIGKSALIGESVVVVDFEKWLIARRQIADPAHVQLDLMPVSTGKQDGMVCQEDDLIREIGQ